MSGYFMLRRSALAGIELDPLGYKILIEVVARGRMRWIAEVGYVFRERVEGESKVTSRLYVDYLLHLAKLRMAMLWRTPFFKFCLVGLTGVVVDMGLLYLLSDPSTLHLGLTRSKIIASETALISNFALNEIWTFREAAAGNAGVAARLRRFLVFNLICSVGLALNVVILNVLFNYSGMNRYLANGLAIVAVTGWNYFLNRKLNWTPMRVASEAQRQHESPALLTDERPVAKIPEP
jgi:dolichol-phosphate mannosyltransferase